MAHKAAALYRPVRLTFTAAQPPCRYAMCASTTVCVDSSHCRAVSRTETQASRRFTARRRRSFNTASGNPRAFLFSMLFGRIAARTVAEVMGRTSSMCSLSIATDRVFIVNQNHDTPGNS